RLDRVEADNTRLRNQLTESTVQSPSQSNDFPVLSTSASKYATQPPSTSSVQQNHANPPPTTSVNSYPDSTHKKGLRLFTPVSNNQGFQYIYLPIRSRKPFKEICAQLRNGAGLNSGSIIDIYYPTSKIVALLVHNDFAQVAMERLRNENLHPIKDFDPLDHRNLTDPQFKDSPVEIRSQEMKAIYDRQIQRTIDFLRPPVKLAVARDFQRKGLISDTYLEDLINLHASTDPTAPKSSSTLQAFRF
ncbi:hypothetical protein, partial, partial [Parasitella parasitica]